MDVHLIRSFHICIVGQKLIHNQELIRKLVTRNQVTLIERENLPSAYPIMNSVNVVLLDCSARHIIESEILPQVEKLKKEFSFLFIIAVNGGLSLEQKAMVFKAGANDYFAEPYDLNMVVERAEFFASRSL